MYVYSKLGVNLPHHAASQYRYGRKVSRWALKPGDLVFFSGLGHVGLFIGKGRFIDAPQAGDGRPRGLARQADRRPSSAPAASVPELRPVDDLEGRARDAAERVQLVVRPLRARRAADVPVGAVVGDDHPVLLQRLEHDPRLPREAGDRVALLQAEAHTHRRQRRVGLVARDVPRRPDVRARACRATVKRSAWSIRPSRHVLVAGEAGQDRQAGGVGGRPAGGAELVRAEVEDRARAGPPAAAAVG